MLFTDGRLLILALALTLVSLPACARDLIVDPGHPQSSDSNSGSPESPLKTIARSAELVQPGDRVIIKPGLYRESIPLKRSGAPGAPISFVAETPGTVVITGADPVANWTRLSGDAPIYRVPWPYQFIINHTKEGLPVEHHPEGEPVWGRAEQVIVDGKQLLPAGTLEALTKGWSENRDRPGEPGRSSAAVPDPADPATWHGMFAVDTTKKELYLWLQDGSDPNTHQVEAATRPSLFGLSPWQNPAGVHDVHLYGLVFRYGATFPQRAAVWLQGEDNLVEGCIIEHMAGSGLSVRGTVRHCVVRYNGQTGGGATGEGFLNEESLWEGNCWKPINRGWDAGGFKMARTKGGVFRRCAFLHNGGPGLWFDIHVENVLVTECVFDDNEGSGVFVEISRNITLLRNLCLRNGLRARGATWSEAGIKIAESMDCVVAHNTCVGNKDGITFREQGPRTLDTDDFGPIPYHCTGDVVVGNLCALNRGYQLGLWYDNGFFGWHPADQAKYKDVQGWLEAVKASGRPFYDPTQQGLVIDRNLYWLDPAAGQKVALYGCEWRPKHSQYSDLKAFTEATGFDARSQVADPGFVDAAGGDYSLKREGAAWAAQAGWLTPPTSIAAWLDGFLPPYR